MATIVETLDGSSWHATGMPLLHDTFPGAFPSYISGISCPSLQSCLAVGTAEHFNKKGVIKRLPVVYQLEGDRWTGKLPGAPKGAEILQVEGVSCATVGHCVAVGYYQAGDNPDRSLVETLSQGKWKATTALSPRGVDLRSVSCPSSATCTAVGSYSSRLNGPSQPVAETLHAGRWTAHVFADAHASSSLASVSCTTSTCVAIGSYPAHPSRGTLIEARRRGSLVGRHGPRRHYRAGVGLVSRRRVLRGGQRLRVRRRSGHALGPDLVVPPPDVAASPARRDLVGCLVSLGGRLCRRRLLPGGRAGSRPHRNESRRPGMDRDDRYRSPQRPDRRARGGVVRAPLAGVVGMHRGWWNGHRDRHRRAVGGVEAGHAGGIEVREPRRRVVQPTHRLRGDRQRDPEAIGVDGPAHRRPIRRRLDDVDAARASKVGDVTTSLNGVSCVSPTSCVAVGGWFYDAGGLGRTGRAVVTWSVDGDDVGTEVDAVSCASAASCVAVGSTNSESAVARFDGKSWKVATVERSNDTELTALTCPQKRACQAALSSSFQGRTLGIVTVTPSSARITSTLDAPAPGLASLLGISCATATTCAVVGGDEGRGGSFALVGAW